MRAFYKRAQGFSFFELTLVVCAIALLGVVVLHYMTSIQARAERVTVEQTITMLQNSATLKVADHIIDSNKKALVKYEKSNPIKLLIKPPANYIGEVEKFIAKNVEPGSWVFEKRSNSLIYVVRFADYIESQLKSPERLKFSLNLVYTDEDQNLRFDPNVDSVEGLVLKSHAKYRWLTESQ